MKLSASTYYKSIGACLLILIVQSLVPIKAGGRWRDEPAEPGQPDLIIGNNINPLFAFERFEPSACSVLDGCIVPGARRLLRFSTSMINVGTADIVLGDPAQNSDFFTWNTCHGHYHRKDSVTAELTDMNGALVTRSTKIGFCLLDTWNALGTNDGKYNCNNQGLTVGWADVYGRQLDCQWVDITGVAPGNYTLTITANANRAIQESNYDNNSLSVPITIP